MAFFNTEILAAKYTITNGLDFNTRIKLAINENYTSATEEKTIKAFKSSYNLPNDNTKIIDISEDGDSSVLAYIKDNIIYYIAEEDVSLNADSSYMFDKFINIKEIDLSEMNFSKVRKMNYMFSNCRFLTKIDMDNDTVIKLKEMKGMFFDCESMTDLYIHMLNTKSVTNMDNLFNNCRNLKNIYINRDYWSVSKVNSYANMFKNCYLLKTNFMKKATEIDAANYKKYARYGEDEGREGLLKDIDYEYDYYGDVKETYDVANINNNAIIAPESINISSNVSVLDLTKAKELSNVNIASDSIFYDQMADVSIKNGKMKFSERLLAETVKDIPILLDETTYVDVIKYKNKATNSESEDIAPEATESIIATPGAVLRHIYKNDDTEETMQNEIDDKIKDIEKNEENIKPTEEIKGILNENFSEENVDDSIEEKNRVFEFNISMLIVIILIAIIILLSIIFTLSKQKKENQDLKDGTIE